jgi:hypothetical protein
VILAGSQRTRRDIYGNSYELFEIVKTVAALNKIINADRWKADHYLLHPEHKLAHLLTPYTAVLQLRSSFYLGRAQFTMDVHRLQASVLKEAENSASLSAGGIIIITHFLETRTNTR